MSSKNCPDNFFDLCKIPTQCKSTKNQYRYKRGTFNKFLDNKNYKYSNRIIRTIPEINTYRLTDDDVYTSGSTFPSHSMISQHFLEEGRLSVKTAIRIAKETQVLLRCENTILEVKGPINVCGDIHGQFFDLMTLFRVGGQISERNRYLFLGDYVDRGMFSTEVILYLFALKLNYPNHLYLLRGNHESRLLTAFYTFKKECIVKYDLKFYNAVMGAFDALPLCAVIDDTLFALHGGLSPDIQTLDDITEINRFREIPKSGPMCDLMWADPLPQKKEDENTLRSKIAESRETKVLNCITDCDENYTTNKSRGISYYFNQAAVLKFLYDNELLSIIRAHELQTFGFEMLTLDPGKTIPQVIQVFSAPNYSGLFCNKGSIIHFEPNVMTVKIFAGVEHPFYLPQFINGIELSLPFILEYTGKILLALVKNCLEGGDFLSYIIDCKIISEEDDVINQKMLDLEGIRSKIDYMTRITGFFTSLRINMEHKCKLGSNLPKDINSNTLRFENK